jgi:dATP pyrophosphohydrolase
VVIYAETKRVLMLQRDDPDFWQSVTGSLEAGETARRPPREGRGH